MGREEVWCCPTGGWDGGVGVDGAALFLAFLGSPSGRGWS